MTYGNKKIYKYVISPATFGDNIKSVSIPKSAKFLKISRQNNSICAWFLIDTNEKETIDITWYQIGTGHSMYDGADYYVNSIICDDLGYVWHIFTNKSLNE